MQNNLQDVAADVRNHLLAAERASEHAASAQAKLIARMLDARITIDRPINIGSKEIDRTYLALGRTLGSMRALMVTHQGLSSVAEDVGVKAWYGVTETVPNQSTHLKAVA